SDQDPDSQRSRKKVGSTSWDTISSNTAKAEARNGPGRRASSSCGKRFGRNYRVNAVAAWRKSWPTPTKRSEDGMATSNTACPVQCNAWMNGPGNESDTF